MQNNALLKLVVVVDGGKMVLYDAKGLKIIDKCVVIPLNGEEHHHKTLEKSQSHYHNKSTPESLFEPHTSPKEIEHKEAALVVVKQLDHMVSTEPKKYKELIIVAEPKMLGYIRKSLSNNLKKMVTKEFAKDLVEHNVHEIEQTIFS